MFNIHEAVVRFHIDIIENCNDGIQSSWLQFIYFDDRDYQQDLSAQTSLSIHNMNIDLYSSSLLGIIQLDGGLVNAYNSSVENWNDQW